MNEFLSRDCVDAEEIATSSNCIAQRILLKSDGEEDQVNRELRQL